MKFNKSLLFILVLLIFIISTMCGCSSMPKNPIQSSELFSRASSLQGLGFKQYQAGQYEKAVISFKKALAIHASVDNGAGVSHSLASLGRALFALDKIDSAQDCFQRSLEATKALQNPELAAEAMSGLAVIDLKKNQPLAAIKWLEKALDLCAITPNTLRGVLLHDLGVANKKLNVPKDAESNFRAALEMHESLDNDAGIATACYSLALLNEEKGNLDQAIQLAQRSLNCDKKCENSPGVAQNLTLLGSLYYDNLETDLATEYYQRALLAWQAMGRSGKCAEIETLLSNPKLHKKTTSQTP